jgi:hypothetical protein
MFNYTAGATNESINLARAGLPAGGYAAVNLWDGTMVNATNTLAVSLNEKQAKLFRLTPWSQVNSGPVIADPTVSAGNLIFSGSNGIADATYQVLTSTNLLLPLASWTVINTDTFDATGAFSITNPIDSGTRQRFYRMK